MNSSLALTQLASDADPNATTITLPQSTLLSLIQALGYGFKSAEALHLMLGLVIEGFHLQGIRQLATSTHDALKPDVLKLIYDDIAVMAAARPPALVTQLTEARRQNRLPDVVYEHVILAYPEILQQLSCYQNARGSLDAAISVIGETQTGKVKHSAIIDEILQLEHLPDLTDGRFIWDSKYEEDIEKLRLEADNLRQSAHEARQELHESRLSSSVYEKRAKDYEEEISQLKKQLVEVKKANERLRGRAGDNRRPATATTPRASERGLSASVRGSTLTTDDLNASMRRPSSAHRPGAASISTPARRPAGGRAGPTQIRINGTTEYGIYGQDGELNNTGVQTVVSKVTRRQIPTTENTLVCIGTQNPVLLKSPERCVADIKATSPEVRHMADTPGGRRIPANNPLAGSYYEAIQGSPTRRVSACVKDSVFSSRRPTSQKATRPGSATRPQPQTARSSGRTSLANSHTSSGLLQSSIRQYHNAPDPTRGELGVEELYKKLDRLSADLANEREKKSALATENRELKTTVTNLERQYRQQAQNLESKYRAVLEQTIRKLANR
ncbi:hypothetical protein GMRT_11444 [Giardia muris]|uniref:Uncharacterized protein n=1 Tax=Giardia muris TaxID=5742 RepID=A0A4Z1T263_GIAMU|nr:hypothetical protein GMRT_11444 [Giardia muris]|eukprot:TNJ29748.1 hypothetical protein GMRT_11444 [Giardia muris]